jgi:hypothetical protein
MVVTADTSRESLGVGASVVPCLVAWEYEKGIFDLVGPEEFAGIV